MISLEGAMLTTDPQVGDVTAAPYEATEEARMLLPVDAPVLSEAARAVGEAAYYLSDTLEPDDRALLLHQAETQVGPEARASGDLQADALVLLCDATSEVEEILRGPNASSELRIALRALRQAIGVLASYLGRATDRLDLNKRRGRLPSALRPDRSKG
jgi:hypothetical protein